MTKRDKTGLLILLALFVVFCATLAYTVRKMGPARSPEESLFVQQRIINLQK